MIYECEHCGYTTNRQLNLIRHKNRKNVCYNTINETISDKNIMNEAEPNVDNLVTKSTVFLQNIPNVTNIRPNVSNVDKNTCGKCRLKFCNKTKLNNHIKICKGVDSLTCHICFERFRNRMQKYRHKKKVGCHPPPPEETTLSAFPSTSSQQNISITNNNNTTNNITNNTTNNIQINVFGKEDLRYLLEDSKIIDKLKMCGKKGVYGLSKIIDDVHFNKDKPENSTLIKPEEFGQGVLIMNDDGEWEYREFEDIRDNLIDTIIEYFQAYNIVKKKNAIKLVDKKERNIIRNIAYEMMAFEGSIPRELFEELEMDEDEVEEDEEELKKKTRKFDKSTMRNLHDRTVINYKRENGLYVRRE
tara:strand:+ start:15623 stop:16699 length:1077 start_codon:yes stop_codon:yes gene_type:complete